MKLTKRIVWTAVACCFSLPVFAEETDSLGMAGDNLDLYGVLEVFKNSKSIEAFEKELNKENNHLNNLDLNEDGEVDYIRVEDHVDGDAHALVLQVAVNENESQDVAVIEIEKKGNEEANIQVVGDEDLYGEDYIVEPYEDRSTEMPAARPGVRVVVNVWAWRPVRFIYAPAYVVWVSPWRWRSYPRWWRPWRPLAWRVHRNNCRRYRTVRVHRVHVRRNTRAHGVYRTNRVTSVTVRKRHGVNGKRVKTTTTPRKGTTTTTTRKQVSGKGTASPTKASGKSTTTKSRSGHNSTRTKGKAEQRGTKSGSGGKKAGGSRTKTKTKTASKRGAGKGGSRSKGGR